MHGSNHEKERIANLLRIHLNGCSDLVLLGGCICVPFLGILRGQRKVLIYTRETDSAGADGLSQWIIARSNFLRRKGLAYESVVKYGSVFLPYSPKVKGPLIGCLLCKLGTDCVHEARYRPTRKAPVNRIGKVSVGAFEDWVDWEVEASNNTLDRPF